MPITFVLAEDQTWALGMTDKHLPCMGESFQDYSSIQDFEADFPQKVSLKIQN